jgi:hypothetical protein
MPKHKKEITDNIETVDEEPENPITSIEFHPEPIVLKDLLVANMNTEEGKEKVAKAGGTIIQDKLFMYFDLPIKVPEDK